MKNKIVKYAIAGALLTSMVLPMFAGAATVDELIAALQAQIATLKAQLDTLHNAQSAVSQSTKSVSGTLKLIRQLDEGITSEQVKLLQTILAADSTIYPEGLVTGFYGRLTGFSVKRYQKKFFRGWVQSVPVFAYSAGDKS